jgi:hypothetical protein
MSIFGDIMSAIFGRSASAAPSTSAAPPTSSAPLNLGGATSPIELLLLLLREPGQSPPTVARLQLAHSFHLCSKIRDPLLCNSS